MQWYWWVVIVIVVIAVGRFKYEIWKSIKKKRAEKRAMQEED